MLLMSDFRWTPPGLTPDEAEAFLTPSTGLPPTARPALHRWIVKDGTSGNLVRWGFMLDFQAASGIDLGVVHEPFVIVEKAIRFLQALTEEQCVYLLDYLLSHVSPGPRPASPMPSRVDGVASILHSAGAGWQVGNRQGRWGLVRVVPIGVAEAVEGVLSSADRASALLRPAWTGAFGLGSSPSHAYFDAVRAVEVYSCPLVSPNDRSATLGKDINVLRTKPEAWVFALSGGNRSTSIDHLVSTMQLLWHSQTDRHGAADYQDVSVAEAQAAVLLASTLVGWFAQGALQRSSSALPASRSV